MRFADKFFLYFRTYHSNLAFFNFKIKFHFFFGASQTELFLQFMNCRARGNQETRLNSLSNDTAICDFVMVSLKLEMKKSRSRVVTRAVEKTKPIQVYDKLLLRFPILVTSGHLSKRSTEMYIKKAPKYFTKLSARDREKN